MVCATFSYGLPREGALPIKGKLVSVNAKPFGLTRLQADLSFGEG